MQFYHPEKIASNCKHIIHSSVSPRTPWCPQCIISAAQADLERVRKAFEAEGGAGAPAYMRDCAWNTSRLRYIVTKNRVRKTMRYDWLRQERERRWEEAHQQYSAQDSTLRLENAVQSDCVVCATINESERPYGTPPVSLTTTWWERDGGLVVDEILVPRTPPGPMTNNNHRSEPQWKRSSYLRNFIRSCRQMRSTANDQLRAWEVRWKLAQAISRKYQVNDEFDMDHEFFNLPVSASHAMDHHRQTQDELNAARRRVNRQKRRAEDYRPARSSLALSELAEDILLDDSELEKLRLEEETAKLARLTRIVAAEVGYLYLVGDMSLLDEWMEDVEQGNLSLIYRKQETPMEMIQLNEDHTTGEEEEGEEGDEEQL